MIRRSFLQALGTLGATAGAAAGPDDKTRFYTLETFFMKNGDQGGRLNDFVSKAFLPAARKVHTGPMIFLEGLVAPHMPQFATVMGFKSAAEAMSLWTRLHEQEGYSEAVARWENEANAPYEHASLTLLEAADYSPEIRIGEPATVFGTNLPNLTYLIPFDDLAAREKAWNAFTGDPEWLKVRKESTEKHGQISSVIQVALYKATPYSPIR
jgi:hypothetical protein